MNEHVNRVTSLGLLVLCMISLCALLISTFSLLAPKQIYGWLVLLCILFWISVVFHRGYLIGMPLSAAVLFILYRFFSEDLGSELQDLLDAVSNSYYNSFSSAVSDGPFQPTVSNHMVALLFILFLFTAFIAVSMTAGNFRITLMLLGTLPVFCLCIAVNGAPPVLPILGLALFWCGSLLSGDVFRINDAGGRTALLGLLPCLAVLAVLLWIFRPSNYQADEQARKVSQRFDRLGNALSEILDGKNGILSLTGTSVRTSDALSGWDHGDGILDLSTPYDFSAQNHEIFRLQTGAKGSFYLRGRSFGDYTGTSWLAAGESSDSCALSYAAQVVSRSTGSHSYYFSLQADRPYDALYLPYYSVTDYTGDIFVPAEGRMAYGGDYYLPGSEGLPALLPDSLVDTELHYRQYVQNYYTRLPDSTRSVLENVCRQNSLSSSQLDIVNRVADFVRAGSTYDIGVEPYPDDDYAVYFLTVNRKGYCIHYATAACALYRTLGIPARICEGFLITTEPDTEITVRGADAHAWVEVYSAGIGWLPVEVTAGSADSGVDNSSESALLNTETENDTPPMPEDENTENQLSEDSSASANNGIDTSQAVADDGTVTQSQDAQQQRAGEEGNVFPEHGRSSFRAVIRIIAFILIAVTSIGLLFFLRYMILSSLRSKRLSVLNGRMRAISLYKEAVRLQRFGGIIPDAVRIPAEKSTFSLHDISEEELAASRLALDSLSESLYSGLSPWKRFLFRYYYINISG